MYTLRTGTATLVLDNRYNDVEVAPVAQLISLFLCPIPTWPRAISNRHTNESSLRDVQYLYAHHVREHEFSESDNTSRYRGPSHTAMDEAATLGFLSVVQFLHSHSLKGCGKYAMDCAAKHGHLHVVQWLYENRSEGCSLKAMAGASYHDHLQVVRYFHEVVERGEEVAVRYDAWQEAVDVVKDARTGHVLEDDVHVAARSGHTEMVAFLISHGLAGDCEVAISSAAKGGHLDIVRFFHVQNVPGFTTKTMDLAAHHGHLDIVQFLHENRNEGSTTYAMNQAAKSGRLDIVQFLHANREDGCTTHAMDQAAEVGRLDIVQFVDTHRHEGCTVTAMDQVAANGSLDIVQYLHTNRKEGCTSQAMTQAALNGHLDVVQFLHENRPEGCDPIKCRAVEHVSTLAYLYSNQLVELDPESFPLRRDLEMVVFLYDHCVVAQADEEKRLRLVHDALKNALAWVDLPRIQFLDSKRPRGEMFMNKAMDRAAATGKLDALTYLHFHGGYGGWTTAAMDDAAKNGHLDIIQFLHHHRTEGCTTAAMDNAAWRGRLDIIQFLHGNRSEGCTTSAMDFACCFCRLDIVQFLQSNRSEGCSVYALGITADMGCLSIAQFLCAHRPNESCVSVALTAAQADKQQYMIDFLESKMPCVCLRCRPTNTRAVAIDPPA